MITAADLNGSPCTFDDTLASARDRLRLLLGDADMNEPLLPDATYVAMLAHQGGDEGKATAYIAQALVARYAREADTITDPNLTLRWQDRLAGWKRLAGAVTVATVPTPEPGGFSMLSPSAGDAVSEYRAYGRYWEDERW